MNAERWQEIKRLCDSVLERKPEERAAYLHQACSDESLRKEVESLLACRSEAGDFLEIPALEVAARAVAQDPSAALQPGLVGRTLLHYRIVEKIGQGGMGEVFLAEDTSLHRKVALKFLSFDTQQDATAHRRFLREARSAAALDHPYICHINEVAQFEGQDFIVMEYVDGQSLKDRLAQERLPLADALQLTAEVVEALEAAHGKGIVHRDIKPANIMLTRTGHAKVMDFGLAKQLAPARGMESATESSTTLTDEGTMMGTLAYMSPERLRGQAVDGRSDIWALGVTLYEMVSGERPFHGESGFELTSAILNQAPRPLPSGVPAELAAVIERCLEKEPGKRYQQAGEVRAALDAIRAGTADPWAAWRYRLGRHRGLALATSLVMIAAVLLGLDVGGLRERLTGRGQARAVRLAVLPFANLTGDPEQEYLSDGMTQEMIAQLGRLHPQSLSVIARTSTMQYKKTNKPIDQIGRELGVDYILEGSARREGGQIRISAELIQVRDQAQLWADSYERELSGILALQSDVARRVSDSMALKLLPAEQARLATVRTVNPEAYDAYLKGTYHWQKLTQVEVDTAQRYLELALQKDPSYASAYEGLAYVWSVRQQMGRLRPSEAGPKVKAAALRAIELDNGSADAHEALALVRTWTDWDWAGAEPEWRRALELNPNGASAHAYYAHFLAITGRTDEALIHSKRSLELDPVNSLFHGLYAVTLRFKQRYDESLVEARAALAIQPDNDVANSALDNAFRAKGMRDEHLAFQRKNLVTIAKDPERIAALERGLAEGGYEGAQRRIAEVLAARYGKPGGRPARQIADRYFDAGDNERALDWLERAYEEHDPNLPYVGGTYPSLRSNPRFQALLRRMNLPL
jgi:serine/threonine-protein kinase